MKRIDVSGKLKHSKISDPSDRSNPTQLGEEKARTNQISPLLRYTNQLQMDSDSLRKCAKKREKVRILYVEHKGNDEIGNREVKKLRRVLRSQQWLQSINLSLTYSDLMTNKELKYVQEGIKYLPSIHSMNLNFSWCYQINNEGIKYFQKVFEYPKSLNNLQFNLGGSDISDGALYYLQHGLRSLRSLQSLNLNFEECYKITDKGMKYLQESFIFLRSLQSLNLFFVVCSETPKITDQGLRYLFESLKLLPLRVIDLSFINIEGITYQGLHYIQEYWKSLHLLQSVNLNLQGCSMSDWGVRCLAEGLSTAPSLQSVNLDFTYCIKITYKGYRKLEKILKSSSSIKNFKITEG